MQLQFVTFPKVLHLPQSAVLIFGQFYRIQKSEKLANPSLAHCLNYATVGREQAPPYPELPGNGNLTRKRAADTGRWSLSKKTSGLFRQAFAVCCAHNLYAFGVQIPHLQPEKYFVPGTRPDTK